MSKKNNPEAVDHNNGDKSSATKRHRIALMIIIPGFLLLGFMLVIQLSMSYSTIDSLNEIYEKPMMNSSGIEEATKVYEDINETNQTVFNILLPVISALMGTVVAFYFGTENLAKAQETLKDTVNKVTSPDDILSKTTVGDLMKNQPETKEVVTVVMDETTIKQVKEKMEKVSNVLIVDNKNKPLGILYKWELKDSWKDDEKLEHKITEIQGDYITNQSWTKEGVKNFSVLTTYDNLLGAKKRMNVLSKTVERRLSVRGVVVDEEGKVIGIMNFANISAELE